MPVEHQAREDKLLLHQLPFFPRGRRCRAPTMPGSLPDRWLQFVERPKRPDRNPYSQMPLLLSRIYLYSAAPDCRNLRRTLSLLSSWFRCRAIQERYRNESLILKKKSKRDGRASLHATQPRRQCHTRRCLHYRTDTVRGLLQFGARL